MAIAAIDAIVDQGHRYGCQMKHLDLGIADSEAYKGTLGVKIDKA